MQVLPPSDWDDSLRHVIDDMRGRPLNIHGLMANHPRLLAAWWDLRMYLVNGGELGRRHAELAILRVAAHCRNWYEWGSHVVRGLDSGLSREEIDNVLANTGEWSGADATLLAAIDDIVRSNAIGAVTRDRLQPHFNDRQVMDLVLLHGMYRTLDCLITTWDVELDAHVSRQLPDGVSEASFDQTVT